MSKNVGPGIIMLLLLAAVSGCSQACYNNQSSLPKAGFALSSSGNEVSISGISIGGINAPNDSLLVQPSATVNYVYLPFRPKQDSASFMFATGTSSSTVSFTYESIPYFASAECGAMYRYRIKSVTWQGDLIDSVAVCDSLITNYDAQQLMIYIAESAEGQRE